MYDSPKLKHATFVCIGSQTFVCIGNEPFRSYFGIGENPKAIEKEFFQWENIFGKFGVKFHDFRCEPRLMDPTGKFLCKSLMNPYTNRLWEAQNWLFENSDHNFRNGSRISRWNNILHSGFRLRKSMFGKVQKMRSSMSGSHYKQKWHTFKNHLWPGHTLQDRFFI